MDREFSPPLRLVVPPTAAGLRLDQALAALTPLSRRRARGLISAGGVGRDGQATRNQSRPVEAGTVLELTGEAREAASESGWLPPPAPEVVIVYEDGSLLAVDKPFGVLSQPAEERAEGELAMDERVLLALALRDGRQPFLRLVHRLDRVTSGLLLFARAPEALAPLAEAWRSGRVERRYLAIVDGEPQWDQRTVEAPIARAEDGSWRFEVPGPLAVDPGKPAATEVRVLARAEGRTRVECTLVTGRTHQVRVHLAHLGHPVSGDRLYGGSGNRHGRPLLHATQLVVPHPTSGELVSLDSAPPAEFV
jgi:23S rRNA pseudouridine1911/1915/1917 synthase